MSKGGAVFSPEDEIAQEVDIEDHGGGGNYVKEEEEREEVVVEEDRGEEDLQGEDAQDDQPPHVVVDVGVGIEQGRPEVIEEQGVDGQDGDQHLVLQTR